MYVFVVLLKGSKHHPRLYECGAHPDKPRTKGDDPDRRLKRGMTPLHRACLNGHIDAVRMFTRQQAELISAFTFEETEEVALLEALEMFCLHGHGAAREALRVQAVKSGASPLLGPARVPYSSITPIVSYYNIFKLAIFLSIYSPII